MSMALITQAAESLRAADEAYHGKIDAINATVAAKSAEVDAFLLTAREKLGAPIRIGYDAMVIHSKVSLVVGVDPLNNSRSTWAALQGINGGSYPFSVAENTHFAILTLPRSYAPYPGHFENPKYSNDTSVTEMDFVVASLGSTTAQINQAFAASQLTPAVAATWSFASTSIKVPIIRSIDVENYFQLFVRFRNRALGPIDNVVSNNPPLPILNFGGNSNFSIDSLKIFRK